MKSHESKAKNVARSGPSSKFYPSDVMQFTSIDSNDKDPPQVQKSSKLGSKSDGLKIKSAQSLTGHVRIKQKNKYLSKRVDLNSLTTDKKLVSCLSIDSRTKLPRRKSIDIGPKGQEIIEPICEENEIQNFDITNEMHPSEAQDEQRFTPAQEILFTGAKFFEVLSNVDGSLNLVAQCCLCELPKIVKGSLRSLSNFTKHLRVMIHFLFIDTTEF